MSAKPTAYAVVESSADGLFPTTAMPPVDELLKQRVGKQLAPLWHDGYSNACSHNQQQQNQQYPACFLHGTVHALINHVAFQSHQLCNLIGAVAFQLQTHHPLLLRAE